MSQKSVAIRDPYYVQAAAWAVLCDARIDWVVTGDVICDVPAAAATSFLNRRAK